MHVLCVCSARDAQHMQLFEGCFPFTEAAIAVDRVCHNIFKLGQQRFSDIHCSDCAVLWKVIPFGLHFTHEIDRHVTSHCTHLYNESRTKATAFVLPKRLLTFPR